MNHIIQSLYDRKSVRVYIDKAVTPEVKRQILDAAAQAPSAGCQQLYTILDITDSSLKGRLAETCDHQPFIAKAPVVFLFCADCLKWYDAYLEAGAKPRLPEPGDLLLAVTDAVVAAQNAVVAAESLGLGSCYIGDILEHCEEHRQMLSLPEWVFPAAMLVMGYPTEQQRQRKKPDRFKQTFLVQENKYHRLSGTELRKMFREQTGNQTFEEFLQAFCERKYNSDFSVEMSRSVSKYLKDFTH